MKILAKLMYSWLLRILLFPLCALKIKNNRILFTGLTGGGQNEYSCNPAYLCEYILKEYPGKFEIVWAVSDPKTYRELEQKGIHLIRHFSLDSCFWLLTARVIVSNGSYAPWFPFRKGQYFINTWHGGGAYKKNENDRPDANWATRQRAKFCADNISLFVSTCKMASKKIFRGTYGYRGEIMEAGMPRNDFLVRGETEAAAKKVRKYYHINPDDKLLLYAPTYRRTAAEIRLDVERLLRELERVFPVKKDRNGGQEAETAKSGGSWRVLYRPHRYQAFGDIKVAGSVLDVSAYPDMQELLAAADMLLTDYSSCIWDYSFLYRPCFLYAPDLEEYIQNTGFYVGIERWPFPAAKSETELCALIRQYDAAGNRRKIEAHHKMMGCAETGHSCELITERIVKVCGVQAETELQSEKKNGK